MRRRGCLRLESDLRIWLTFEAFEQAGGRMLTQHDFRREDDPPPPVSNDNVTATPAGVWEGIRLWKLSRDGEALTPCRRQ
jgi:hypothetical protein